jgi:glycosyltransferase involved in cell wall biosynthesis
MAKKLVSVVIPAYNETQNIVPFFEELTKQLDSSYTYEFIFVDDGSTDDSAAKITQLHQTDKRVKLIAFSRNFGKELAVTAGIQHAMGDAIITIDADGQHPVEYIPKFLQVWEQGSRVVVGVRKVNKHEGFIKKYGSRLFYKLFNSLTRAELKPGSTDFRLIDKQVQRVFNDLPETNRITRGLIDWLGFQRAYLYFAAKPRLHGEATYSTKKLLQLAVNSFVSLSFTPLHAFGYLGFFITLLSFVSGVFIIIEQYILKDPLGLRFTGSASLGILVVFLVGIILISQWLTSLYISRMYEETKRRPLFIVDKNRSILK